MLHSVKPVPAGEPVLNAPIRSAILSAGLMRPRFREEESGMMKHACIL